MTKEEAKEFIPILHRHLQTEKMLKPKQVQAG